MSSAPSSDIEDPSEKLAVDEKQSSSLVQPLTQDYPYTTNSLSGAKNSMENTTKSNFQNLRSDKINTDGDNDDLSVRKAVGGTLHRITQVINDNLIAARYGIFASVCLLTAYGLSNTPLFFRFRTVSEVPASYFVGRRRLYGRIVGVDPFHRADQSIHVHVRHLSPVGQILPKTWFDFFMRMSPHAARLARIRSKQKPEETRQEVLRMRIAGIQGPPVSKSTYQPGQFLERLAKERTLVSCQLLARQIPVELSNDPNTYTALPILKRQMSDILPERVEQTDNDLRYKTEEQVAICRLYYRPTMWQIFPTDIAETLISTGNASVSSSILVGDGGFQTGGDGDNILTRKTTKILDSSHRIQDLRNDVKYLDRLAKMELDAAQKSMGMWSVPEVRESKREVVEEVEFQTKANIFQKIWRRFRG